MNEEVKWIGEERTIPTHGVVSKGVVIALPKELADSFIFQGLAVVNVAKQEKKS